MPAVVVSLMAAAAPAGACVTGAGGGVKSARPATIAKGHGHARSHKPRPWMEFGRKVG